MIIYPARFETGGGGGSPLTIASAYSAASHTASGNSYTTGSFTPTEGGLMVLWFYSIGDGGVTSGNWTVTDSQSRTWTRRTTQALGPSSGYHASLECWTAPTGSSAATTITAANSNSVGGDDYWMASVVEVGNFDTGSPITQTDTETQTGTGAESLTLGAAPASTGLVIAARGASPASADVMSATPGTGWTEVHDLNETAYAGLQVEYRTGSTSTDVAWNPIMDAGSLFYGAKAAIEIAQA